MNDFLYDRSTTESPASLPRVKSEVFVKTRPSDKTVRVDLIINVRPLLLVRSIVIKTRTAGNETQCRCTYYCFPLCRQTPRRWLFRSGSSVPRGTVNVNRRLFEKRADLASRLFCGVRESLTLKTRSAVSHVEKSSG